MSARRIAALLALTACSGALASTPDPVARGRRLFNDVLPACASCHGLRDASASGAVGPSLDETRPDAGRVATVLRSGLGEMPSYQDKLTAAEIDLLARYVAKVAGPPRRTTSATKGNSR